jgi:hypothetical protein
MCTRGFMSAHLRYRFANASAAAGDILGPRIDGGCGFAQLGRNAHSSQPHRRARGSSLGHWQAAAPERAVRQCLDQEIQDPLHSDVSAICTLPQARPREGYALVRSAATSGREWQSGLRNGLDADRDRLMSSGPWPTGAAPAGRTRTPRARATRRRTRTRQHSVSPFVCPRGPLPRHCMYRM